jgi:integrase
MTFELWLHQRGYRPSTVKVTVRHAHTAREVFDDGGAEALSEITYAWPALRRYLAWALEEGLHGPFLDELRAMGLEATQGRPGAPSGRVVLRESYPDADWLRLAQALHDDFSAEGTVIFCLMCSGLRIGDLLTLTMLRLSNGLMQGAVQVERKGGTMALVPVDGAKEGWARLADKWATDGSCGDDTVASWLTGQKDASPLAGDAAYQRVNRHFRRFCEELGIDGPNHLHRLRRTVAVQALRITEDAGAVQQLLGQKSIQSTYLYLDELRRNDVARLQGRLAEFRRPK